VTTELPKPQKKQPQVIPMAMTCYCYCHTLQPGKNVPEMTYYGWDAKPYLIARFTITVHAVKMLTASTL